LPHQEESAFFEHFISVVSSRCPCLRGVVAGDGGARVFLMPVHEVLGRPGFILTRQWTVRRSVVRLETHVRLGELLATKIMWSQGDMWLFIFFSKYQMPNYSYELFDS
jgi:hypothetical protein